MKKTESNGLTKWTVFFLVILLLGFVFSALHLNQRNGSTPNTETPNHTPLKSADPSNGVVTNEAFAALIEENLAELAFVENITFKGEDEGHFQISGTVSSPERIITLFTELKPYKALLSVLKGETVTINGHLGEDDNGYGCFVTDTVTFTDYTVPAGIATEYIEEYTGLNDLLEVPIEQINLTENGISFSEGLPGIIQTALYNQAASSAPE